MLSPRVFLIVRNELPVLAGVIGRSFHASKARPRRSRKEDREAIPVAIVLSGCGYLDGTEISEAMAATYHICKGGMVPTFYAPDANICTVIDHYSNGIDGSSRNVLVESARLARSKIKHLSECDACRHGALVIPGGFGAAKILSDFAENGACCTVLPEVEKVIEDFNCARKPIGTMCIASAVVARVLKGVKVTLGKASPKEDWPFSDAIAQVKEMGAKVEMKDVKGVTHCKEHNVFSTPAWLYKHATYRGIYAATGKMISMIKKNMKRC